MSEPNIIKFQFFFVVKASQKLKKTTIFKLKNLYIIQISSQTARKKRRNIIKISAQKYNLICYPL